MPGYQQVSWTARNLSTDEATLRAFDEKGWIQTVEKNGLTYIAADQRYRAKFILHLRREKHLTDEQIDRVLAAQQPPYSSADVDRILQEVTASPAASGVSGASPRSKRAPIA